ncbi:TIGR02147 family protein [Pseudobacteriovorax antillogorgiicola]|uniref:TIGR02147 family protein n=1 Tax=Pseudobacteriovorax antillogorgiicola TaxID=1513793 RepID=UPI00104AF5A3|nr:TIGR02147 family protein [Pseudobacteriovorax antillogorgiicola]
MKPLDTYSQIILNHERSITILDQMIKAYQKQHVHQTLAALSKKIGLKSRSNLSEALRGRRKLSRPHWQSLLTILGAEKKHIDYVLALFDWEHEKSATKKDSHQAHCQVLRRQIEGPLDVFKARIRGMNFAVEVYCAFALFSNEPERKDLVRYFGKDRGIEVDRALALLLKEGLIEKKHTGNYTYRQESQSILYLYDDGDTEASINFLQASLQSSSDNLPRYFSKKDESLFASTILTIKKDEYKSKLKEFKESLLAMHSSLQSDDPDSLLHINIQVFPSHHGSQETHY